MNEIDANAIMHFTARRRDVGIAYMLSVFNLLGLLGAHRFYLGCKGSAIIMLILSLTVVGLIITAIWLVIDLFLIPDMVREHNDTLRKRIRAGMLE